jgi:hypothetical protein
MLRIAQTIRVLLLLGAAPAAAQPGLTLRQGAVSGTLTVEIDASADQFGEIASIAPDLAFGVTDELTLSLIHSTFGRTGFRGAAGGGICATDGCANTYDNAGVEALYALRGDPLALAANVGVHATSFDRGFFAAKLGAKARYKYARITFAFLPSVTIALGHRNDEMPNRDRLWLPVSGMYNVSGGLSFGASTGFKTPLDDVSAGYEIAAGLLAQYAYSPAVSFGASWVHGKIVGGSQALPDDTSGLDSRAIQLWISATH